MRRSYALIVLIFSLALAVENSHAQDQSQGTWSFDTSENFVPHTPYFTTCVLGNKLYLLGGMTDPEYEVGSNLAESFDPVTNTWTAAPDLPNRQGWSTSSVLGSKIYDIGGADTLVQIFDSTSNQWSLGPPLPTPRNGASSCVVDGKIYVIGGANEYNDSALSTVEIFYPSTNTWSEGIPMPTPRYNLAACALNDKIYAIGGISYEGNVDTVEILDPATNTWSIGPSLPSPTQNSLTASVMDGMIYALVDGNLYVFDPSVNAWKVGPSFSNVPIYNSNVINNKLYAMLATDMDFPPFEPDMLIFTPSFPAIVSGPKPSSSLVVYPNPAASEIQILAVPSGTARLFDPLGRMVLETNDDGTGATLDVSRLEAGTYFLRIGEASTKVVIVH